MLLRFGFSGCLVAVMTSIAQAKQSDKHTQPNIVIVLADDLGYGDVGCFGARDIKTPHIDRLATEGRKLTHFYVSQAVCTASRASLMTGCYANRVGLSGALNHTSIEGIHPSELLLPELLQRSGYATAIFGKWHLGTAPDFHPMKHGFDSFAGIPYSNDNSKYHPVIRTMPPLPFYEGTNVAHHDVDQSTFTRRFTEHAVHFIEQNKSQPFFLYVPHVMPHVPIFASDDFEGRSQRGLYGDVVQELDWSVGEITGTIDRLGLAEKTLILFLSDNGPFLSYGNHAGSAGVFREGKLTSFEGGIRTPCIARWRNTVPLGTECTEMASTMDLLPTIAKIVDQPLSELTIDGRDIRDLLVGTADARSPHASLCFYSGQELQAVRSGRWKLHFPHDYLTVKGPPGENGKPAIVPHAKPLSIEQSGIQGIASRHGYSVDRIELALFDLVADPGETMNIASSRPDLVQKLQALADVTRTQLGDSLQSVPGSAVRQAAKSVIKP